MIATVEVIAARKKLAAQYYLDSGFPPELMSQDNGMRAAAFMLETRSFYCVNTFSGDI